MKVAPLHRPPLALPPPSRACAHASRRTCTLERILRMRAYICIHTRMHCCVHTYVHTYVFSGASQARAPLAACRASAHRRGRVSAAAAALTGSSGWATRPPPAAPRSRCRARPCAPTVRPRPGGSGQPRPRAGRPRAPAMRARGSAAPNDRQRRRRRTQRRAARPGARHGSATRSSAAPARPPTRTAAGRRRGTHRVSKSLHWQSHSGSAFTFVKWTSLPRTARACGPRPPRNHRRTWARTGRNHGEETTHARAHTRIAHDRHTGAFGAAIVR